MGEGLALFFRCFSFYFIFWISVLICFFPRSRQPIGCQRKTQRGRGLTVCRRNGFSGPPDWFAGSAFSCCEAEGEGLREGRTAGGGGGKKKGDWMRWTGSDQTPLLPQHFDPVRSGLVRFWMICCLFVAPREIKRFISACLRIAITLHLHVVCHC